MAKQRIQNYVFLPGVSKSSNAYPHAYSLLNINKDFIKAETVAFINQQIALDNASNIYPNAVALLTNNKAFIIDEIIAWIAARVTAGTPPFGSYTYSQSSCRRDSGLLIDAYIYDLRYGGNELTIEIARNFWQGGTAQLISPTQEIAGFAQIATIINNYIIPKTAYTSEQSPVTSTQNLTGAAGEAGATTVISALSSIIINVIPNGLSVLPTTQYSIKNYAGYIYEPTKCLRDIGLILDAYLNDLRYGGNAHTRYVSSRFWNGTTPQLSGDRKPEITAQTWIRDLIINTLLPQTAYSAIQTSVARQFDSNITTEANAASRITSLSTSFINVLTNGLDSLPALVNGVSTIKLQGKYDLDTLLLITNSTHNEILYNFTDPSLAASVTTSTGYVSNDYWQDDDYPSFRNTVDYVTTITLAADTSTHNIADDVQIFVEAKEMKVRPYDFGTDAIERHRVAMPQSMLDADFEYGLQPTKWQAIGISRGYPSVYEVPGTDTAVLNVTTDASSGVGGIGESLITVTTSGPHGIAIGTPFTIKSLANSISGFSRAEGTFIVNTVPTTTTFTYYAQSKVGTTNGQVLATTYTQLRKAAYYTGASIGQPAFSVFSNGQVGSFTSKFITASGTDQLAFTGTAPVIGAPLSGTGITLGAQVTGVVGTGGIVVSPTITSNVEINATSFTVADPTGILEGMAINNGTGTSSFVAAVTGNTVNLTSPLTAAIRGSTQTFTNISGSNVSPAGISALFTVDVTNDVVSNVTTTTAGTGYVAGDRISIAVTSYTSGSNTTTEELRLVITTVDGSGGITGITFNTPTIVRHYTGISPLGAVVTSGVDATFDVTVTGGVYSISVPTQAGAGGYVASDTLVFLGSQLGGVDVDNDLAVIVTGIIEPEGYVSSVAITSSTTGLVVRHYNGVSPLGVNTSSGANATFDVTVTGSVYSISIPTQSGVGGYLIGDTLEFLGSQFEGVDITNNVTVVVNSVSDPEGYVLSVSITSTTAAAVSPTSHIDTIGTNINPVGANGAFTFNRASGSYTTSITSTGTGYVAGDRILVLGANLGGTTPAHNAAIKITSVNGTGGITAVTVTGNSIGGQTVDFYSAVSFSELTSASIPDSTTISTSAIATLLITFSSPHGLVPGSSILVDISSSGTNHTLARGPFYVESIPTSTTLRYTARAAGTVDAGTALTGIVYTRPDSYFIHRPYDGGVQLGTGGPQHGAQAIRMSKKYIRYQSGKGINYCTGALFAPSFGIQSLTATGTAVGSFITIVMDDVDHGCQVGGVIKLSGVETKGYIGKYTVSDVVNERTLKVQAIAVLANVTATLTTNAQMSVVNWHGATVRAGTFDDQNGIFFQYDGQNFAVGKRSSTFQLSGVVNITKDTNLMTGTNTRFRDQVKAGDRVVIKGMTHVVSGVLSQTQMTVNPDYRGAIDATQAKVCLVQENIIPQSQFNIDRIDGTGPSGYNLDITKMQMIGMQWSWYAVGFIDFMLRGSDGNFIFFHRIRNSNVNTEAYMRTGNQPVRYEVINESGRGKLLNSITASQTTIPLVDASTFPNESGVVMIDQELIAFSGKSGNTLIGCTRTSPMTNFVGGSQRTFRGSVAATHEFNTGVILVSNTISPIISHWGSAMLTDGNFDSDRGYIFNYAATNLSVSTTKQTAFLIRLAPSVSNAIVGDLGERELLNRAQLLLKGVEITADSGTGGIVVEGVLNPQNYPTNPTAINWVGLQSSAQGGQPSFAQIAPGGSVSWSTGATQTTSPSTSAAFPTGSIVAVTGPFGSNSAQNGYSYFAIDSTTYTTYAASGLTIGDTISGTSIPSNTTITGISFWYSNYYIVYMSNNFTSSNSGTSTFTVTRRYSLSNTSTIFFQKTSWESVGAVQGTEVSDALFPAGAFVSSATLLTYFSTQYYRVTFTQTSTSTPIVAGTTTITFKFGQPPYALPGETVFSFIAAPGTQSSLDLNELKELTNTTLGGRGCYPNGPDVLAINVYKASGTAIPSNIVIRWGEAQA